VARTIADLDAVSVVVSSHRKFNIEVWIVMVGWGKQILILINDFDFRCLTAENLEYFVLEGKKKSIEIIEKKEISRNLFICQMLEILYQDEYIIAINKPSGLLVHKSFYAMQKFIQELRNQIGGQHVYPVHRLDRKTSGVLLFALIRMF
jgi:23S rRNA-/tRNA-specific pseudouridylate synthase